MLIRIRHYDGGEQVWQVPDDVVIVGFGPIIRVADPVSSRGPKLAIDLGFSSVEFFSREQQHEVDDQ